MTFCKSPNVRTTVPTQYLTICQAVFGKSGTLVRQAYMYSGNLWARYLSAIVESNVILGNLIREYHNFP